MWERDAPECEEDMNGTVDTAIHYYQNYTPVGDITVLGMCLVVFVLMRLSFNVKSKNYHLLKVMMIRWEFLFPE